MSISLIPLLHQSYIVHFPYSKVRIWALRKLGFSVGEDVYVAQDLCITQNFVYDRGELFIGDRVSIAPRVTLILASHANRSKIRRVIRGRLLYSHR